MSYTKGPWTIGRTMEAASFIHCDSRLDPRIAYVYGAFTDCPASEAKANARLIASAPDLLEACKALVSAMTQLGKEHHREVAQAQAAIAKAESTGPEAK